MMKPRPIRIEGDMAYVPLTKGYEAVIDAADVYLVGQWNWCAYVRQHTVYAARKILLDGQRSDVRMHRLIMNASVGMEVDHINCNGLDNRRGNLRIATPSQNQHNQRLRRDNTSGFKGVSWDKIKGKWQANIRLHGKQRNIGRFETSEEAYAAYIAANGYLHQSFGRIA